MSGERMKRSGVDGLSRGDLLEGIMASADPLSFVPFHLGANDRGHGRVGEWIRSWWGTSPLTLLTPEGWFSEAQGNSNYLWVPPPAAMASVLEQLEEARHKRPGADSHFSDTASDDGTLEEAAGKGCGSS